ncbi:MAG: glycosyltransferase family 9 protein [candidate division Zixibacteria bacterium]|nr:glycosyltransferase family 9 protein [candidate division Zixibacteria bacterium]
MGKVLFLRPEKIGDMVISLPVFDALRARYPHMKVSVLASPRNYVLVKNDPRFDRIFLYRKWTLEDFRQLGAIRHERFDCVFDMIDDDSVTTLFYSQLAGPQAVRIGIGKRRHAIFYDFNHVHADGVGEHIVDNTLKLLEPFGINGSAASGFAPPYVTEASRQRVDEFLGERPRESCFLVGLNLSAGKPNRIWPDDRAIDLCRRLTAWRRDFRIIVIVIPNDRERGERVVAEAGDCARMVPDGLNLIEVSALISRLRLLISPDTSLIHIARSFQVPVVGLYSRANKNFQRWRPYRQSDGTVVGSDIDTIYDITAEQVFSQIQQVLARIERESK